ncbi:helix-turn-helix transcriptional regulator [Halobacillus sp. ACCC02827]|uniref:helix-turn-helix transcriptional regulator n=1 Tax=Halobacillus sp. ACCC02827 TaxID=3052090 RepID=UPI0025706743|nr:helix-turn-helix transcriptional regulator [Halobacillus sp. ACCC02827]WJE15544.1 helix-turn-helix transcriptional regulator [Halobacillus sp. ACCC02827]
MEYGKVLRFHRVKQGLTQNQLADGIISPAYLSKIENNQTVPASEVLEMLYERLGLEFHDASYSHPSKEKLKKWYEAIMFKRKEEARRLKEELLSQQDMRNNHHLYIYYKLYSIRHFLLENEVEEAYEAWSEIKQHLDTFDDEMKYYYHLSNGLLQYYRSDFEESFQQLMKAEVLSRSMNMESWEVSDLFYHLALSSSQAHHVSASIFYTEQALRIYKDHYDLGKSADCHLILGISFSRLQNHEKARENYESALKIASQTKDHQQLKLVYINMAVLDSNLDNHTLSIEHYKKSLEYTEASSSTYDIYEYMNIIHGLILEHYLIGNKEGCLYWVNEGKKRLVDFPSKEHTYHFDVFQKILTNAPDTLEFLEDEVLPYFKEMKDPEYVIRYAKFLADLFEKQRMYKRSSEYLRLAMQLLNKHSHLGGMIL